MSDKQDFSEIGDRIKDAVQDAVNSGDFGQLNHVINDSVNGALDEVRWQVNQAHERVYKRTDKTVEYKSGKRSIASSYSTSQSPYRRQMEQKQRYTTAKQYQRPDGTIVYKNTINVPQIFVKKGKVSGVLLSVFGGIGLGTFGLTALIMAIIWAATSSASLGGMTILFGLMAAACGGVLKRGGGLCKRLGRAERYLKLAGEEMYIRISELSEKTGWTPKKLGRDIRTMIESGMFPEGHMDEKNDIFVIDDETWEQYLEEKEEYEQQIAEKKRKELTADVGQSAGGVNRADGKAAGQNQTADGAATHSEEALTKEAQIEKDGQAYMERLRASIIQIWTTLGYNMLICLAGLQSIPTELYEAAMMDGAGSFRRWRYITIPLMRNNFIFLFITGIISGFSRFTDLYILSGNSSSGKPAGSLQTILMYIYQYSFENPSYGLSCAGAVILFIIVFTVTAINLKVTKTI